MFCDADRLSADPLPVKPVPATVICEIFTVELPVFVIVTFLEELFPVFTLPKLNDVGLTDIVFVAATALPLRAIVMGELGALLTMDTLPVALPVELGANTTLKLLVAPEVIVSGVDRPLRLKPEPVTVA